MPTKFIGTEPYQVPRNADLGNLAYQNKEFARLDNATVDGSLLLGTTVSRSFEANTANNPKIVLEGVNDGTSMGIVRNTADAWGGAFYLAKSRGTAVGGVTAVASGDSLGAFVFSGADGTDINNVSGVIQGYVDGAVSTGIVPGRVAILTADSAGVNQVRAKFDSTGLLTIGSGIATNAGALLISSNLDIAPTASGAGHILINGNGYVGMIGLDATGMFIGGNSVSRTTRLLINETERFRVNDNAFATFASTSHGNARLIGAATLNTFTALDFGVDGNTTPIARIGMYYTSGGSHLYFGTSNNYASGVTNFGVHIDPSGVVGIGTAANTSYTLATGSLYASSTIFGAGVIRSLGGGSVSAPSIQPGNDGNTGFWWPAADNISAAVGGTEIWRVEPAAGACLTYMPSPAPVNATATLTIAQLIGGTITTTTAAAVTMTLPTGTLSDAAFTSLGQLMSFHWTVINTGPNAATIAAGTGHTVVGNMTVAAGTSGTFRTRKTAANTFITYRI